MSQKNFCIDSLKNKDHKNITLYKIIQMQRQRQRKITQNVKQVERAICSNETREYMEFFPNCTHPKCLRVTLVKMKNDFSGPACVLYANTKSSTLHGLRHLDRDSVLPGVRGETRDGRNILHARDYQYARNTASTFFLGERKRERNYCLDISETWRACN